MLSKSLTTVTPFSKTLAMILFIALPFIGFYLGMQYQERLTPHLPLLNTIPSPMPTSGSTTNWKTYTNDTYKFSVKIPPNWEEAKYDTNFPNFVVRLGIKEDMNPVGTKITPFISPRLWLHLQPRENEITSLQEAALSICPGDSRNSGLQKKSLRINNKDVLVIKNSICGIEATDLILWMDNSHIYVLGTNQGIDNFLSTFTFTDQTPSPTCRPRPACLDQTPRCMVPETSNMCPPK